MHKVLISLILLPLCSYAAAPTDSITINNTNNDSLTTNNTIDNNNNNRANANNNLDLNIESKYSTSSAIAAALTASSEACMGSSTGGVQGMSFGVSAGTTWQDKNCNMRKDAVLLFNMGFKIAAIQRLCESEEIKQALLIEGIECSYKEARLPKGDIKIEYDYPTSGK
jgi:hypothetical protein